jgi:hypothetical protein
MSAQDMFQMGAASRSGERNFWIGAVSTEDFQPGPGDGFSRFGHGYSNVQAITRMKAGDGFIGYALNAAFNGRAALACFAAIGVVKERPPYFFAMGGVAPHRGDIDWADSMEAPVRPWLDSLEFAEGNRNWDQKLRFGYLAISERDFRVIARAMHADLGMVLPRAQALRQQMAG